MQAHPNRVQALLFRMFLLSWTVVIGVGLHWVWFSPVGLKQGLRWQVFESAMILASTSLLVMSAVRIKSDTGNA